MRYLIFFAEAMLCTVGILWLCGYLARSCTSVMQRLLGGKLGYNVMQAAGFIGAPVHELGHAACCPLFGHRIVKMALWQPHGADGVRGYVFHTCNQRNFWHRLGNLFIGLGPLFSGLAVILGLLLLCFPDTTAAFFDSLTGLADGNAFHAAWGCACDAVIGVVRETGSGSRPLWVQIPGLLLMSCVSLYVRLSLPDVKIALSGMPFHMLIWAGVTVTAAVADLLGVPATETAARWMTVFGAAQLALFGIVAVITAFLLLLSLVYRLIRLLISFISSLIRTLRKSNC